MAKGESSLFEASAPRPLADRLRPKRLADVVGQDHLLSGEGPIARMVAARQVASFILWGPPGCGKTTIARLLSEATGMDFVTLSAVTSGVPELRKVFEEAQRRRQAGRGTLLFVDEIHRFNRAQQDAFLPHVEDGTITLIGATTENPSFELNAALLSRMQVFVLRRLDDAAIEGLLGRAENEVRQRLPLNEEARAALRAMADGDGRYALTLAEALLPLRVESLLDLEGLTRFVGRRAPQYDKGQEAHYNLISALHKSMRGSDPDAALYWLCRMLAGGEDPRYLARRMIRFAAEDIGMAEPQALTQALAALETYERLGSPEGEIALAQACLYLACAPKSNAVYVALKEAMAAARENGSLMPPAHILNAPTGLMRELGYGKGYAYDHEEEDAFSGQDYFPEGMARPEFYRPSGRGAEALIAERLKHWQERRKAKRKS